ncbi:hypothetical protein GSI_02487 [Ganoderma sinense ZZ0214-1]|uniref:Uncharacterized protein n=1 Tax=Ganoderma sinense ZZ0214-1 TaxID=1077348 RepID=A0A2G8SPQ7_9APHY|nr:hypothetical protein GSI_02487 [Ganoderma sinense ZZ0214-1]
MPSRTDQKTVHVVSSPTTAESGSSSSDGTIREAANHHTNDATKTQAPGAPPRKMTALDDNTDEGIDDILCVAIGIYDLPSPLDAKALAQLQQAVAELPAPQLRQVFIALVDALPEVPDQMTRLWTPDAQTGTGAKGPQLGQWMCTRCFYTPTPHHHPWE